MISFNDSEHFSDWSFKVFIKISHKTKRFCIQSNLSFIKYLLLEILLEILLLEIELINRDYIYIEWKVRDFQH